ncbi:hypothetical protein [Leptospira borgpetersenii]|uniref:hypothetical protein n=1 Tax=Leptospira borgpetersenii TaxID=174 RepID=UPI00051807E6|nr:hypothetical protein [Leptospira borgpetersenii]
MTEYFIYFKETPTGFAQFFRTRSRSLLGAKQRATRILNSNQLSGVISVIEIQEADSTDPFWVAHKFIGSKKWSSFV